MPLQMSLQWRTYGTQRCDVNVQSAKRGHASCSELRTLPRADCVRRYSNDFR